MATIATIHTDKHSGKQYRIPSGNSTKVKQYPAGAKIAADGSTDQWCSETNFKSHSNLKSWLQMMGFDTQSVSLKGE